MKKIGILTLLYQNYNYGGTLQAYALTKYLCLNGYDARGILYNGNNNIVYPTNKDKLQQYSKREILKKVYQKFESKVNNKKIERLIVERKELFLDFQKRYIPVSPIYNDFDLPRVENEFDFFISGSDQVWNPNCAFGLFLQTFVKNNRKKISYAASISRNSLSTYEAEKLIPCINQFQFCSVREKTAQKILQDNGIIDVEVVLDPTFLLTREQWNEIIPDKVEEEKYVLAYFFSDSKKYRSEIQEFCRKKNLKLYYIPYAKQEYVSTDAEGEGIQQEQVGPLEFLRLIRDAEVVFTDSFHGVALSINLEKEFIVFERDLHNSNASMNSRIYDILKLFNLEDRLISGLDSFVEVITRKIDYVNVKKILIEKRSESERFLKIALSGDENKKELENIDVYNMPMKYYAAYSQKDAKNCSSGGIFACMAKMVLKNKGIVYGVGFDDSFNAVYKRIDREENLNKILGSKYVRSIISKETLFYSILEDLKKDKFILFSGVGCQIYALRNYLKKNNCSEDKLITIEVLCHGTPSSTVWESYKYFMERKYKSVITDINFRDKKYGWNSYSMYMKFKNGKIYRKIMNADPYMQVYLSGYSVNNGCQKCKYKRNDRIADITLGDLWGISLPEFSDILNEGVSLVSINTDKGQIIYNNIKESLRYKELNEIQKTIALSNMMGFCTNISEEDRKEFNALINKKGFKEAYKVWKKLNKKYYWISNIKSIIKRFR